MAESPELWAFVLANTGMFLVSGVLAVGSYIAYRQSNHQTSFQVATCGFVLVMLGGLVEPIYQLVVRGDTNIDGAELLWLQSGEGILIAIGLGLLFYAITHHDAGSSSTEKDLYKFGPRETDE